MDRSLYEPGDIDWNQGLTLRAPSLEPEKSDKGNDDSAHWNIEVPKGLRKRNPYLVS